MSKLRLIILAVMLVAAACGLWLWLKPPPRSEMTQYAPAESVIYLEAAALPALADALTRSAAWQKLAPTAGLPSDLGSYGWLGAFAARTGWGSADTVVLTRTQAAAVVLGFDATEADTTLKIKPRFALILETHTDEARARAVFEKRFAAFAQRSYGAGTQRAERSEAGATWLTWSAPGNARRIVAVFRGSLVLIGADEDSLRACLEARDGKRQSLQTDAQLKAMRGRVGADESDRMLFGYATPAGVNQMLQIALAINGSGDGEAQGSALSSLLPNLANRLFGHLGWSARLGANGAIEDRYFLALQNNLAAGLVEPLAAANNPLTRAAGLLPANTYSVTQYNVRDPRAALLGLSNVVASQSDVLGAVALPRLRAAALKQYGIDDADVFLRAVGDENLTARLTDDGDSTVAMYSVRDAQTLRGLVKQRLGANARSEKAGNAELIVAADETRGAACFANGYLLLGQTEDVRACYATATGEKSLALKPEFLAAAERGSVSAQANAPAPAVTFTNDQAAARIFIFAVRAQLIRNPAAGQNFDEDAFAAALAQTPYAVTETRLTGEGFTRRTRSSFGIIGTLFLLFAPQK